MQFGPSSRTELLELGGEDEIEKMKEGTYRIAQKLDWKFDKFDKSTLHRHNFLYQYFAILNRMI